MKATEKEVKWHGVKTWEIKRRVDGLDVLNYPRKHNEYMELEWIQKSDVEAWAAELLKLLHSHKELDFVEACNKLERVAGIPLTLRG